MLFAVFNFVKVLFYLAFFPAAGLIIGGFLDYGNRVDGNFRYDIPSTLGFIFGCLINIYVMFDFTRIFTTITILSFLIFSFVLNEHYIKKYRDDFDEIILFAGAISGLFISYYLFN